MTNGGFESHPVRLARLLASSETPSRTFAAVRRNRSTDHHLQSAVVTGKRVDPQPVSSLRLPKLPSDIRPQPAKLRPKGGVTPRLGHKNTFLDPSDPTAALSMNSTLKQEREQAIDFIQRVNRKVQRLHHSRVSCSHSPEQSLQDEDASGVSLTELQTVLEQGRTLCEERKDPENSESIALSRKVRVPSRTVIHTADLPFGDNPKIAAKLRKPKAGYPPPDPKPPSEHSVLAIPSLYTELNAIISRSNGLLTSPAETNYRCYMGPGNNSQLIAFLMKRRWFWTRVDSWQQADFIWTQHKQSAIVEKLEAANAEPCLDETEAIGPVGRRKRLKAVQEAEKAKAGLGLIAGAGSYAKVGAGKGTGCLRVYNRIERNYQLTSKKRLFANMQNHYQAVGEDVFSALPLTFLIKEGPSDPEFSRFREYFQSLEIAKAIQTEKPKLHNIWIIKPGENTNCGHGIHVSADIEEIANLVSFTMTVTGRQRSYIVQKYMERPLLVNKRKFDIRCYGLVTSMNGHLQGYFYHDGYLRTSSKEFTLKNTSNRFIHLTNDAVQKKSEDYGKFENGNKMSYPEFQKYLEANFPGQVNFWTDIWPQIKKLVTDSYKATSPLLDPVHRLHTFEVLGYDFMIDDKFKVWLIEVNTNPCLSLSSAYLAKLIPAMLDNAFRIAVDPYFLEPYSKKHTWEWSSQPFENKFELVFSSLKDACAVHTAPTGDLSDESEESEEDAN